MNKTEQSVAAFRFVPMAYVGGRTSKANRRICMVANLVRGEVARVFALVKTKDGESRYVTIVDVLRKGREVNGERHYYFIAKRLAPTGTAYDAIRALDIDDIEIMSVLPPK